MLKAKVVQADLKDASPQEMDIQQKKEEILLNDEIYSLDLIEMKKGSFHVIRNNRSYLVEILKVDLENKTYQVQVNKNIFEVSLKSPVDVLLNQLGMETQSNQVGEVKAPMPGLILDIKISPDQSVKKGDPLLILEAMKMENVIKSPVDGQIKSIKVKKGDNVEKNAVLVDFA